MLDEKGNSLAGQVVAALGHFQAHGALDLFRTRLAVMPATLKVNERAERAATRRTPLWLPPPLGR